MASKAPDVAVVRTGAANLASVLAAFERLGVRAEATSDAQIIRSAPAVVLPGVGAFGPAVAQLRANGLDAAIHDRIEADRPTLCVCLGCQLLANESAESPGVPGLGVVEASVGPIPAAGMAVPHLGWNDVHAGATCRLLSTAPMYFANSFGIPRPPAGWASATTTYGGSFVSAFERGRTLACQFHPELSGDAGRQLISRWLATAEIEAAAC